MYCHLVLEHVIARICCLPVKCRDAKTDPSRAVTCLKIQCPTSKTGRFEHKITYYTQKHLIHLIRRRQA